MLLHPSLFIPFVEHEEFEQLLLLSSEAFPLLPEQDLLLQLGLVLAAPFNDIDMDSERFRITKSSRFSLDSSSDFSLFFNLDMSCVF